MCDASHFLCLWVMTGCDSFLVGATMAALSKKVELLEEIHIGRLLMRRGIMSSLASTSVKVCYVD